MRSLRLPALATLSHKKRIPSIRPQGVRQSLLPPHRPCLMSRKRLSADTSPLPVAGGSPGTDAASHQGIDGSVIADEPTRLTIPGGWFAEAHRVAQQVADAAKKWRQEGAGAGVLPDDVHERSGCTHSPLISSTQTIAILVSRDSTPCSMCPSFSNR